MKEYSELTEWQKEIVREQYPDSSDYKEWCYQFRGVVIDFCAK